MWRARISTIKLWWRNWRSLPVTVWVKAAEAYRNGQFMQAEQLYLSGLDKYTNHPARFAARLDLAFCLFKLGKFRDAEEQLQMVVTARPEVKEAYLRLARLQMWTGRPLAAAWTLRRATRRLDPCAELGALFLLAVLDSQAPAFLLEEGKGYQEQFEDGTKFEDKADTLLATARARLVEHEGDHEEAIKRYHAVVSSTNPPVEALIYFARLLIKESHVEHGRGLLRKALHISPSHPQILSTLAHTYLMHPVEYGSEFAVQLSVQACQASGWLSAQDVHLLAQAYALQGQPLDALMMARKAKELGSRLLGTYPQVPAIDTLIQDLMVKIPECHNFAS